MRRLGTLTSFLPLVSISLALAIVFGGSPVQAWSPEGHAIVVLIAEPRLTPEARAAVTDLLEGTSLVDAANWADQTRNRDTAPWHYVNIELSDEHYEPARHCPKHQCVIGQIERFQQVLANRRAARPKRQKALKYLLHFVGDLHQPLHAGENHDRGGNEVVVQFLGQTTNPFTRKPWNLHAVWDSGMLEHHNPDAAKMASELRLWLDSRSDTSVLTGSPADWAMQSHDLARDHAYNFPEDRTLDQEYVTRNILIVSEQLARAGARLAHLLNTALAARETPKF